MISIIIPCYNEERRIIRCLDELMKYMSMYSNPWEIIPVDDGSTDGTWRILEQHRELFPCIHPLRIEHAGKGKAVRTGMLFASGEIRGFMDVDLSTALSEIPSAIELLKTHDVVIGSRALNVDKVQTTFKRFVIGRIFHAMIGDLVPGIHDTQCGFKFFRRDAAEELFGAQKVDGMAFDVEILYLARLQGFRVEEFPVEWVHDADSRVKLVSTSLKMFLDVLDIPMLHAVNLART